MKNSQAGQADIEQQTIEMAPVPFRSSVQLETDSIILDRYKVIELLGRGGMGSVYRVQHLHLQADYALKVLDAHSNESTWRRFENEARAATRLDHPNLIKVHDSGLLPDGQPFFVMEMVPGITLADLLKKKGRLPLTQALSIFIQVGFALAYAHENGVIHRDLKPSNIMLVENTSGSSYSSVKVVDLGIAKLTGVDEFNQQTLTKTGEIFGSPLYMSPEQCIGNTVDRRTDLYSLGCVMYEVLTGAPPMIGDNALSTMMKHQSEKPLSLKEASLGIVFPQAIEQIVANLLEKDPNSRYSNAQLLTAALVDIQQSLQESEQTHSLPFSKSELVKRISARKENFFSWRNIATVLLIVCAYFLGYLQGGHMFHKADKKPPAPKKGEVKQLEDNFNPIPNQFAAVLVGEEIEGTDPYMNTGTDFFTKPAQDGKVLCTFPATSIGEIGIVVPYKEDKMLHRAQGVFTMPSRPIAFRGDKNLFLYPRLLEKFRPGELVSLSLRSSLRDSKEMMRILPQQNNLIHLDLSGTLVKKYEIAEIGKLPRLQRLFLAASHASADAIASMPNLLNITDLDLTETQNVSGVLTELTKNKVIRYLRLKRCNITQEDLKTIAQIHSLINLDLNRNQAVNNESLKILLPLKKLVSLNVENCPLTPECTRTLQRLPLEKIFVTKDIFTEDHAYLLKKALPKTDIHINPTSNDKEGQNFLKDAINLP